MGRSFSEIQFRVLQEFWNLRYYLSAPGILPREIAPLPGLPPSFNPPDGYRREILDLAEAMLAGITSCFGQKLDTSCGISWRRDPESGKETGKRYFRLIPYLDVSRAGDHKRIWEINRHQHWVVLAQAFRLSGRRAFLDLLWSQFEDWEKENPFQCGINWASALEVGFRAMSWIWVYHLVGDMLDAKQRKQFLNSLYRHGLHLERNLSIYFSPNTHLIGEALALGMLGRCFPTWPRSGRWEATGRREIEQAMRVQVHSDGSYYECSSSYHVYAFDMFLLAALLWPMGEEYREKLVLMGDYLDALLGPRGEIPLIGDDDGGRLFHPYGTRSRFGRASLACARRMDLGSGQWFWGGAEEDPGELYHAWLGDAGKVELAERAVPESRYFDRSGLLVLRDRDAALYFDTGGWGPFRGGHTHADALSIVLVEADRELLIDPGTYTYVGDMGWRDRFRGTAMHNTVRVNGRDQARSIHPFAWETRPMVAMEQWETTSEGYRAAGVCRYEGIEHRRELIWEPGAHRLEVRDTIRGEQLVEAELFWHLGQAEGLRIEVDGTPQREEGGEYGWRSRMLFHKEKAPVIRLLKKGSGEITHRTVMRY
jgi:hypothetical protein